MAKEAGEPSPLWSSESIVTVIVLVVALTLGYCAMIGYAETKTGLHLPVKANWNSNFIDNVRPGSRETSRSI